MALWQVVQIMVETAALYHHHNGLTKVNHPNRHNKRAAEIGMWGKCEKGCASRRLMPLGP